MTPRISIVTSTYNRSALLRRAIDSVRAQRGVDDWEMCIVGDCTPFFKHLFTKNLKFLLHGRRIEDQG